MLLDLRMPGKTGLELLARLPRPLPVPVVVLSGEASPAEGPLTLTPESLSGHTSLMAARPARLVATRSARRSDVIRTSPPRQQDVEMTSPPGFRHRVFAHLPRQVTWNATCSARLA
jgi:CheY-like chemotaxis protein